MMILGICDISKGVLLVKLIELPCTERYARWCERSANQLMISQLLNSIINNCENRNQELVCYLK